MSEALQRTPLYEEHLALGARMVDFAGYEMPVQYHSIVEEHTAVREACGIFDVSHMAEFRVSGAGAFAFLQHMLTNDMHRIDAIGAAQYTLLLDDDGHLIDDLIVYNTGNEYLIICNASNHVPDWEWLVAHKPADVELQDESERTGLIAVQGPEALRIIGELCGPDWQAPERFHIAPATLDGSVNVLVARTGYTGEDGVELVVRAEDLRAVWRILLSFPEVMPCGLGARDTLRLEMGYALYGNDMDRTRDPISAGLGWAAPKSKSGYIGSDEVARIRAEGPREKLVYLTVKGGVPRHGYPVYHGDEQIGTVGSGSHAPSLGYGIATAYVPAEYATVGTELGIGIRRKTVPAIVVKAPFLQK